jgi:lysozyme family protein
MRSTFDAYMPELLRHEGGYVDHPRDPGGATNMGVTIGTLAEWRGKPVTRADVRNLSRKEAAAIYRKKYWDAIDADSLPEGVDALAFDIAVNHGIGRWRRWKPLIEGLDQYEAIKAVTAHRRKFYRSLKTFGTFGKGWMRRADEVEAWAIHRVSARRTKNTPINPRSRTAQGTVVAGGGGSVVVGGAVADAADTLQKADGHISAGTWFGLAIGLLIIGGAGYAFYARWRDGGGLFPWEKP